MGNSKSKVYVAPEDDDAPKSPADMKKSDSSLSARNNFAAGKGYRAFISHMKAEGAMEARFLQTELESILRERVFLDSDDLRSLHKLCDHVLESRCLVLLQTRAVLTRPYCLLELLTAIEHGVPIVGVTVAGRADAYDFADAMDLLTWLDERLEELNPGAGEVLAQHGYADLTACAYKISHVVPKIISVQLNVCASRNILKAAIQDISEAIDEAKAPPRPSMDGMEQWLGSRTRRNNRPEMQPRLRQHGDLAPAATTPAAASATPEAAPLPPVSPLVGRTIFAAAKARPALLQLAFLLQAVTQSAAAAAHAHAEAGIFGACTEALEQIVLRAEAPEASQPAVLQQFCDALDRGAAALEPLGAPNAKAPSAGGTTDAALRAIGGELRSAVESLQMPAGKEVTSTEMAIFVRAAGGGGGGAAAEVEALRAQLEELKATQAAESERQRELSEMQNRVLLEQVKQLRALVGDMPMQRFMTIFPQSNAEGERRLVLQKAKLETIALPLPQLDVAMRNLHLNPTIGPPILCAMIHLIGECKGRCLSFAFKVGVGAEVLTPSDISPKELNIMESMGAKADVRKFSGGCQYVTATGETVCHSAKLFKASPESMPPFFASLAAGIPEEEPLDFKKIVANDPSGVDSGGITMSMGVFKVGFAREDDRFKASVGERFAASAMQGVVSAAVPMTRVLRPNRHKFVQLMATQMKAMSDLHYVGVPVRVAGSVIGSLCCLLNDDQDAQFSSKLEAEAERMGAIIEQVVMERASPPE